MKTIPTLVHGIFDYVAGILLLLAPALFGFDRLDGSMTAISQVLGCLFLLQGLFARHELGVFKLVPTRAHLFIDYAASILLAVSPWLTRFHTAPAHFWLPQVVLGLAALIVTFMSQREPRRIPIRRPP